MKIMPLHQTTSFGKCPEYYEVKEDHSKFYNLSTDQKLNVLFDTLNTNSKKLAYNQNKMQEFNKVAIKSVIANNSREGKMDGIISAERLCQLNTLA